MKKNVTMLMLTCAAITIFLPFVCWGAELSNSEILREFEALKSRMNDLEKRLKQKDQEIETLKKKPSDAPAACVEKKAKANNSGFFEEISERITFGGLVEVGAVFDDVTFRDNTDEDSSDINLTTIEIALGFMVTDWLNLETVFLYEDAMGNTTADESDVSLDVGTVIFGNPEKCPYYAIVGKMYVPFGALLTHFPDDPLVDQPMTLAFGEINEKAVLLGYENYGLFFSGYVFNGEVDESASDNSIEDFGFDLNYSYHNENAVDLFAGVSFISNVGEGLSGALHDTVVENYVEGLAAYMHLGIDDFFFESEYMRALDEFSAAEIADSSGNGAEPVVWNIETGYLWNWGKRLEIALKYAGSKESGALGYAKDRYGICFNQEIYDGVTASLAWYRDRLHDNDMDGRDRRNILFGQVGVEF